MRTTMLKTAAAVGLTLAAAQAGAVAVTWTDWTTVSTSGAAGTMGGVGVTVNGTTNGVSQASCSASGPGSINYWTEPNPTQRPYTGGTVSNGPTACEQVGLNTATTITISFTSAVDTLYMALLSVGQPGITVTYDFNRSFTVDSAGVGYWSGGVPGTYSTGAGDTLTMREFHGMLRFTGGINSLTFTTNPGENWHAFTLGTVAPVASPGSLALAGLGLLALGLGMRRQRG